MATGNSNFDTILSTTLNKHAKTIEDIVFTNNALLYYMTQADNVRTEDGGAKIVEPLLIASNSTAGSYAGFDSLPTTPAEGISAAEYDWKQMAVSVTISGLEKIKNHGDAAIINLMDAKVQQSRLSLEDVLEDDLFADGTGNSSKAFFGLKYFIPDDPTAATTIGNISSVDNTVWRSSSTNVAGVLAITGSNGMSHKYNSVSRGKDHPDFGLTTQLEYEAYEALLQPAQRFSNPDTGAAGFDNLLYKNMAVMYADSCQSGVFYFLNSKYLSLVKNSQEWFTSTPFQRPVGQNAWYSEILLAGNVVSSNLARLGKLYGLTD